MAGGEELQRWASLGGLTPPAASALRHEELRLQPLPCAPPLAPAHRPAITACPARGRHRRGWRLRWGRPLCGSRSAWPSAQPSQRDPGPGLGWCQQGAERERNQALLAGHKWTGKSTSAKPSGKYSELCSVSLPPTVPTIPFHPVNHPLFPKTLTAWLPEGHASPQHELHNGCASFPASFPAFSSAHAPQSASTLPCISSPIFQQLSGFDVHFPHAFKYLLHFAWQPDCISQVRARWLPFFLFLPQLAARDNPGRTQSPFWLVVPDPCNSFNWTVLPATEAVRFFSNLILKFLSCSLYLFLHFSSLSLPTVRNTTEQAPIKNNMQIKCKMSYTVNVITNTSRDSDKSQANLQQPLILNALVHQTSILFPSKCLLRHQFLCKAHWCLVEMPPVHEWKENILGSKGRSCSLYHSATYSV